MSRWSIIGGCASLLVATLGCNAVPPAVDSGTGQWYHARVVLDSGDEVPFFLEIPADCSKAEATIANGEERIPIGCRRLGASLILDFPVYGTRLVADVDRDRRLSGYWARERADGTQQTMRFEARPVPTRDPGLRFPVQAPEAARDDLAGDVTGVWRITFEEYGLAKGLFDHTSPGVVRGTAEVPSQYGDLRFLAGNLRGTELSLSTFDGLHAFLLNATLAADGTMQGQFVSSEESRSTFVAERSEEFEAVDPLQQVRVTSPERQLNLKQLQDPTYAGKAVIVEVFGTWCPNCNDLAPFLAELHREHRADGLEILGLAYELSEQADYNRERLRAFNTKHGLDWEVIIADAPPNVLFAEASVELSPIEGVPVTIFLNRDRTVHAIYTGFLGPATGDAHSRTTALFRQLVAEILNGG